MRPARKALLILLLVFAIAIFIPVAWLMFSGIKMHFHLDFSQGYRKIDTAEKIIFWDNRQEQAYTRAFWGLEKTENHPEFPVQDTEEQHLIRDELKARIHCENAIDIAILSSDGKYILYREIEYNHYKSDMTDDEYCYYRIYHVEAGKIITIYKGYREWFRLAWQA